MNFALQNKVVAPPIVAFKDLAKGIKPRVEKVFDLTQAVPSYPTFQPIRERLKQALADESTSFYTEVPGLLKLREKISELHPLKGTFIPDEVLVTAGANHAMYTAFTLLFNPGDRVLLLEPYYFNYDMALKMLSLEPVYLSLSGADGFKLNVEQIIQNAEKDKVKGVVLITPNNPTGACYDSKDILQLADWANKNKIELILDETYMRFDSNHLNREEMGRYIQSSLNIVGSFSKSFSLTGYRVGYFITSKKKMSEALKIQDTLVICAPHHAQIAALYGLEHCESDVKEKVKSFRKLENTLRERCLGLKKFQLCSSGAYFAFLKHPFLHMTSEEACLELYKNTGILGLPGTVFGESMRDYLRLAFCNISEKELEQVLLQLLHYDQELS